MQLADLVKPIDQMSDEELLERIRTIRHNRETFRAAVRKREERTEVRASRKKISGLDKLMANLSNEERDALVKQLENTISNEVQPGVQTE